MGMVQCALDIVHCGVGHPAAFQDLQPLLRSLLFGPLLDEAVDLFAMLNSVAVGDEARIGLPLWIPKAIAQHPEEPIIASSEEDVSIAGLVAPIGDNRRCEKSQLNLVRPAIEIQATHGARFPIAPNPSAR